MFFFQANSLQYTWNSNTRRKLAMQMWTEDLDLMPKATVSTVHLFVAIITSYSTRSMQLRKVVRETWLQELLSNKVRTIGYFNYQNVSYKFFFGKPTKEAYEQGKQSAVRTFIPITSIRIIIDLLLDAHLC